MTVVGSAEVEVRPLTTEFTPELEAKVNAALAGIEGKVSLAADAAGLRESVEAAVQRATAGIRADIELDVDLSGLRERIELATAGIRADLHLDVDLLATRERIQAELAGMKAKVAIEPDESVGARVKQAIEGSAPAKVRIDTDDAAKTLAGFQRAIEQVAGSKGLGVDFQQELSKMQQLISFARANPVRVEGDTVRFESALDRVKDKLNALENNRIGASIESSLAGLNNIGRDINFDKDLAEKLTGAIDRAAEKGSRGLGDAVRRVLDESSAQGAQAAGENLSTRLRSAIAQAATDGAELGPVISKVLADAGTAGGRGAGQNFTGGFSEGFGGFRSLLIGLAIPIIDSVVSGLNAFLGAATAAGGAAVALGSSLGTLAASAAALPSILGAAAQATGVVHLALAGVTDAYQLAIEAQKAAALAAVQGGIDQKIQAHAIETAQKAIANAADGVAKAQESAAAAADKANQTQADSVVHLADAVEQAAFRQADAARNLQHAQQGEQLAQEALTDARVQARFALDDLILSVERLTLSEARARLNLAEAQAKAALAQKRASLDLAGVTDATLKALETQQAIEDKAAQSPAAKAALDLADAQLNVQEAVQRRTEGQAKLNGAQAKGIEQSDQVVSAQRALASAAEQVALAQRGVSQASKTSARDLLLAQRAVVESTEAAAKAQADGASRIEASQEALSSAIVNASFASLRGMTAAERAADRYQAALGLLGPTQRQFVEFLVSLHPQLKAIEEQAAKGLLPGVEDSIRQVLPLAGLLAPVMQSTGGALSGLAREAAALATSPAWRRDLVQFGKGNVEIIRQLGSAGLHTIDTVRLLTLAAQPLALHLSGVVHTLAVDLNQAISARAADGRLNTFFGQVSDRIDKVLATLGLLGSGLLHVFRDAIPAGDQYLGKIERLAARFDLVIEKASQSGAIKKFFEDGQPAVQELGRLVGSIADLIFGIGRANFGTFIDVSRAVRQDLLPAIQSASKEFNGDFLVGVIQVVSKVVELYGALFANNLVLKIGLDTIRDIVGAVDSLVTKIPVLSPVLQGVAGGILAIAAAGKLLKFIEYVTGFQGLERVLVNFGVSAESAASKVALVGGAARTLAIGVGIIFATKAAFDQLNQTLDKHIDKIVKSHQPSIDFEATLRRIDSVFPQLKGNLTVTAGLIGKIAEKSPAVAQRIVDDMARQGKATGTYQAVLDKVINDLASQGVTEDAVTKKVQAATDALKGKNTALEAYIDNLRAANAQLTQQSGAELDTLDAIDRLTQGIEKNGLTFDENTAKGRENLRARNDVIDAIGREVQGLLDSAQKGQLDADAKQRIIDHIDYLAKTGYPEAEQAAANLRLELASIQSVYTAKIDVDTKDAIKKLKDLLPLFKSLAGAGFPGAGLIAETLANQLQGRELGGRVLAHTAYIVGEKRPEVFVPDENGTILPNVARPKDMSVAAPFLPHGPTVPTIAAAAGPAYASTTATTQQFNAPLVKIDNTFGPGSAVPDLLSAMEIVAEHVVTKHLEAVGQGRAG